MNQDGQYVSRAAYKLESVVSKLGLNFSNKTVLDVGSSTGGFTDFALQHGAKKVIAVDAGKNQLHVSLRSNSRIELHEQTDIRDFGKPNHPVDIVLIDVSFVSLRQILPTIANLVDKKSTVIAMAKPQFETTENSQKNRGIIKNENIRRQILKDLELWIQKLFKIINKGDSQIAGSKGNIERFYALKLL